MRGPAEDQVKRIGGLTLLDHVDVRGEPLHSHVVPGQPHGGRLAGEQRDGVKRGAIGGPLPRLGDPVRQLLGHGGAPGGKMAWYSRCPRLWSRTCARNASVVSSEIATWSGWPYPPSAPKVITVSGSNCRMMPAFPAPSEDRWCCTVPSG